MDVAATGSASQANVIGDINANSWFMVTSLFRRTKRVLRRTPRKHSTTTPLDCTAKPYYEACAIVQVANVTPATMNASDTPVSGLKASRPTTQAST